VDCLLTLFVAQITEQGIGKKAIVSVANTAGRVSITPSPARSLKLSRAGAAALDDNWLLRETV
jgi:hypothetical protein